MDENESRTAESPGSSQMAGTGACLSLVSGVNIADRCNDVFHNNMLWRKVILSCHQHLFNLILILALFQNKYWIMMTGVLALFFLYYAINGGTTVYYAKEVLGDADLVSTINGIYNAIQIIGMFLIAKLVKKYGKRNVFSIGLILAAVGMLILEFGGGSMPVIVVTSLIRGVGNACGGATMWAMVSDTIDYGEWKTGYRTEGLVNSACSFGYKIGNGVGSALLGLILEIGGYVGTASVQTASAVTAIRVCFVWIPIGVFAACFLILRFYHLDDEFEGIIDDLKKRAADSK